MQVAGGYCNQNLVNLNQSLRRRIEQEDIASLPKVSSGFGCSLTNPRPQVAYLGGQRCVPRVVEAPEAAATNLQRQERR